MSAKKANTTKVVSPGTRPGAKKTTPSKAEEPVLLTAEPEPSVLQIPLGIIDLDPTNYRQYYDPVALEEFVSGLKAVGFVISPVTVRVVIEGRYQLVVGKRRYLGANMAGLTHLPAVIRKLTDEEVEEIQLQENIQREDPHPMHEAEGICRMYNRNLSTAEIALRLGKSVDWVYRRFKLSALTGDLQEMFLANAFTLGQAYEIADLSLEAQQGFFDKFCKTWKERRPTFSNLSNYLSSFRCDLGEAPFDHTDALLFPEAGACMGCRFNTAYKGLLIPDLDREAKCTRRSCFDQKVQLHLTRAITTTLSVDQPVAFITDGELPGNVKAILESIPGTGDLPLYQEENVTLIEEPEMPDVEDFKTMDYPDEYYDDSESEQEEGDEGKEWSPVEHFDQEGYDYQMEQYKEELAGYQEEITNGRSLKGYYLSDESPRIVYYYPVAAGKRAQSAKGGKTPNIKELIAAKKDTPELLEAEISRIQSRETRFKELDREKVQKQVHKELLTTTTADNGVFVLTEEDRHATRWLIFQSLTHQNRSGVETFLNIHVDYKSKPEAVFDAISKMSEAQFSFLIRMALSGLPESTSPKSVTGYFLRRVAEGAGINTDTIESKQKEKAQTRKDNQDVKIALYKKRIKRHESKQAA